MKDTKPTPQTIRAAWNAATFYTQGGSKREPSAKKMAKAFGTTPSNILKIVKS
jgi:hypothetical protein